MLSQTCLLAENILYDHKETIITSTQSMLNCLWHLGSHIKWCNDLSCPIRYLKIVGSFEINGLSYTCPKPCIIRHYFLLVKIPPCRSWKKKNYAQCAPSITITSCMAKLDWHFLSWHAKVYCLYSLEQESEIWHMWWPQHVWSNCTILRITICIFLTWQTEKWIFNRKQN